MWLTTPLSDILSSRSKGAILRVICAANGPLSGREIARRAGVARGHASRSLRELTASGLLVGRDLGRAVAYELGRPGELLTSRLCALYQAEAEREALVLDRLARGVPGLLSIILFGSEARDEARPGSDTDLLIVVAERTEAVEAQLSENCLQVTEDFALALSWEVADLGDLREWDETGHPLWHGIIAEGVALRGKSVEVLRRLCRAGGTG
jgi:predicted nucleotidyltransferase